MKHRLKAVLLGCVLAVSAAACGGSGEDAKGAITLDGTPRIPDLEGVATKVTTEGVTIDGRTYRFAKKLQAFDTYTLELEPVVSNEGQFVQVGLDGETVVWLAGIGDVLAGDPPFAVYAGTLVGISGGRAVMRDGTTLAVPDEAVVHVKSGKVQVRVNAETGAVLDLSPA